MRKAIETNNGLKGGLLKGKAHYDSNGNPLGGIKAVVTDQGGKPIEVEGNEVIINKKTVQSDKVLTVKGTPKEILSTLNQMDGNGVAIGDEEAEILAKYRTGGKIGGSQNKEIERLKNLPYSKFLLEVLDSYKELNAEVGVKGYNQNSGEPIIGYFPNQYEYMYRSDSTGKPIRFFIDLGNEKYIHPFDINPKFNASEQKRIEQKADYFIKDGNENYEKSIKELKDNNELDIVVETLKKALKTFNIENQYDSSDIFKSSGNSILESKDENKRRMKFDIYYFRVNDSELKSNIKNLDLERFKDEYLAKYRTGGELIKRADGSYSRRGLWDNIRDNVGSGRKPTKQMLEQEAKIKSMKTGGSISRMTPSELKAFYASPEGRKLDAQTYAEWKRLVNMSKSDLEKFYNSVEGKKAGLSSSEANRQGIDSGRESARWIMKMKDIPYKKWSSDMWRWAKKQISFIKRMSGMKGSLYNDKGEKTRKHTALLIWGHNPEQKFKDGGGIGDEVELELYQVRFDTDDDSEVKLVTTSYEDAKSEYEGATIGDFGDSEFNVSLEKKIDKYKFVYELDEDESIDDYPIEEYYDDSYYYELIEEGEFDNIENRVVTAFNSSSEDLLDEVQEWAKDKFGNYKYNTIDVYSEDDIKEENDSIGSIQLRIADHSQNESNLPYGIDRSLSVVIANKDATRGRFQQNRPQIYFYGSDSFDYVTSEIENYIEDAKEYIQSKKFAGGGRLRKFRGGGELSQKALAVETNDLTDFVRKYFIKDGRIDVSDAMQELFGNKRGKSIADEYRKRIGLHKKGGLTISQLAHNLWEQHRDEVREDIDDSDFRNAVEEVLISEYGVSSMIKSLMEKSGESEQDRENEYWMNQFDEGDDEYYEDLSDEEVADYFRDMEGFERELAKGTEHEMEHLDTLKKVAEGKITPEEAVVQTAKTHIEENPEYYEDLQKMELEALKDKLKNQGYNVTIPSGGNRISVMGYGKGYFNAKKQKADSILSSLKRNGYNAVSKLDADGYYDFWVYADEPKQDLAKMEMENEDIVDLYDFYTQGYENTAYQFGYIPDFNGAKSIEAYSLGSIDGRDRKTEKKSIDELEKALKHEQNVAVEEESIPDLIEGLKVLADSLEGAEKKEIEDVIEGLEILLESDDKFAEGGEILWATKIGEPDYNEQLITENPSQIENAKKWAMENGFDRIRVSTIDNSKPDFTKGFKKYKEGGELDNNSMFFEPSKADQEEEKRIMENQFGKNI